MENLEFQIAFGQAVQEVRVSLDMSQEELADACGMHRTYVSDIERGRRNTSLGNAKKVAGALGMSLSSLIELAEVENAAL